MTMRLTLHACLLAFQMSFHSFADARANCWCEAMAHGFKNDQDLAVFRQSSWDKQQNITTKRSYIKFDKSKFWRRTCTSGIRQLLILVDLFWSDRSSKQLQRNLPATWSVPAASFKLIFSRLIWMPSHAIAVAAAEIWLDSLWERWAGVGPNLKTDWAIHQRASELHPHKAPIF